MDEEDYNETKIDFEQNSSGTQESQDSQFQNLNTQDENDEEYSQSQNLNTQDENDENSQSQNLNTQDENDENSQSQNLNTQDENDEYSSFHSQSLEQRENNLDKESNNQPSEHSQIQNSDHIRTSKGEKKKGQNKQLDEFFIKPSDSYIKSHRDIIQENIPEDTDYYIFSPDGYMIKIVKGQEVYARCLICHRDLEYSFRTLTRHWKSDLHRGLINSDLFIQPLNQKYSNTTFVLIYLILHSRASYNSITPGLQSDLNENYPSPSTMAYLVLKIGDIIKTKVRNELLDCLNINISFDTSTKRGRIYLAITATGLNIFERKIKKFLLAFKEINNETADVIRDNVVDTIHNSKLEQIVMAATTDNCSAMRSVFSNDFHNQLNFERMPCICHLFNLIIKETWQNINPCIIVYIEFIYLFSRHKAFINKSKQMNIFIRKIPTFQMIRWASAASQLKAILSIESDFIEVSKKISKDIFSKLWDKAKRLAFKRLNIKKKQKSKAFRKDPTYRFNTDENFSEQISSNSSSEQISCNSSSEQSDTDQPDSNCLEEQEEYQCFEQTIKFISINSMFDELKNYQTFSYTCIELIRVFEHPIFGNIGELLPYLYYMTFKIPSELDHDHSAKNAFIQKKKKIWDKYLKNIRQVIYAAGLLHPTTLNWLKECPYGDYIKECVNIGLVYIERVLDQDFSIIDYFIPFKILDSLKDISIKEDRLVECNESQFQFQGDTPFRYSQHLTNVHPVKIFKTGYPILYNYLNKSPLIAMKELTDLPNYTTDILPKLPLDTSSKEYIKKYQELSLLYYDQRRKLFAQEVYKFWESYPTLGPVAIKILSLLCSSAITEGIFSMVTNILPKGRDKLKADKIEAELNIQINKEKHLADSIREYLNNKARIPKKENK